MKRSLLLFLLAACGVTNAQAQRVQWTSRDTSGNAIAVPAPDRATIVAFIRPDQPQSLETLKQINDVVAKQPVARVVLVLSGPDNVAAAGKVKTPNPIVLDPEYALSGQMAVHVWPETVLVAQDGTEVTRLAGLPHTFAADLSTQLDFAAHKIDAAARDRRLTTRQVVAATTQQSATRFLIIANALLERDQVDQARAEIERGLKMDPNEPSLRVALIGVMVRQKQFAPALQMAEQLNGAIPSWHVNQLRAEALIGLDRWADAKAVAADAVRLNPRPAHAHYLCGLILAHDKDYEHAAESFRRAYEASERKQSR